jgi:hypothetical protein
MAHRKGAEDAENVPGDGSRRRNSWGNQEGTMNSGIETDRFIHEFKIPFHEFQR